MRIDDIEDHSNLRRGNIKFSKKNFFGKNYANYGNSIGLPVAHSVYGIPLTLNAANYTYFIALQKIIHLNNEKAIKIFSGK